MSKSNNIQAVLFDLDDTISIVDDDFMVTILSKCLSCYSKQRMDNDTLRDVAHQLRVYNHSSPFLSGILSHYLDTSDIESFWDMATDLYGSTISSSSVGVSLGSSQLIKHMDEHDIPYGVISNTHSHTGMKTLRLIKHHHDIDLVDRTLFLDQGSFRKPSIDAYKLYVDTYDHTVASNKTAYVGNTVGDVQFAINNQMQPFFIRVRKEAYDSLPIEQRRILDDATWIDNLGDIIDYIN